MVQVKLDKGLGYDFFFFFFFLCEKPVTRMLNSKNKESSLHYMLPVCSRWDAALCGETRLRDGT